MTRVSMYCTAFCPYCVAAERFLKRKGIERIEKIRVDTDPARRAEMMERTGLRTVPQIYVDDHHVGGFDELAALDHEGKLDSLLKGGVDAAKPAV